MAGFETPWIFLSDEEKRERANRHKNAIDKANKAKRLAAERKKREKAEKEANAPLEGEDAIEEAVFQEQCLLIENYDVIARSNFSKKYKNFTCLHGDPAKLISSLHVKNKSQSFWDIKPDQLARLHPTIRIFKVRYDEEGKESSVVPMPFADYVDPNDISSLTTSRISRGQGVGLMSFDWKFQGSDPATAANLIEAELKLRFDTIEELTKEREVMTKNGSETVSFIEFFTPQKRRLTTPDGLIDTTKYNPNYYTFKIIVGWADPGPENTDPGMENIRRAIMADRKMLVFTLTNHNMEFQQEGPVMVSIFAHARIDSVFYDDRFSDVFAPFKNDAFFQIKQELKSLKRQKKLAQNCKTESDEKNIDDPEEKVLVETKEELKEIMDRFSIEKTKVHSRLLNAILEPPEAEANITYDGVSQRLSKRIFTAVFPLEKLQIREDPSLTNFSSDFTIISRDLQAQLRTKEGIADNSSVTIQFYRGDTIAFDPKGKAIDELENDSAEATKDRVRQNINFEDNTFRVNFFYLGDLLDVAFRCTSPEENPLNRDGTNKILLGDIVLYDPRLEKKFSINLADIPISVNLFQEWFVDSVYRPQKEKYPLKLFIKDVVEKLVVEALQPENCFVGVPKRKIKIATTHLPLRKVNNRPPIDPNSCGRVFFEGGLNTLRPDSIDTTDPAEMIDYTIIYAADNAPGHLVYDDGNLDRFTKNVFYFSIGRDRGLIKTMNFSRNDMPGRREARIVEQGDNDLSILTEHYTVDIEMVGNQFFIPGQIIYVNPSTIALGRTMQERSIARALSLVGFYQILEVSNYIESGVYRTNLKATWIAAGNGYTQEYAKQAANQQRKLSQDGKAGCSNENVGVKTQSAPSEIKSTNFSPNIVAIRPEVGDKTNTPCDLTQIAGAGLRVEERNRIGSDPRAKGRVVK